MKTIDDPQLIFDTEALIEGFDAITPYNDSTINEVIELIWDDEICFIQTEDGLSTNKENMLLTENPVYIKHTTLISFLDLVNGQLISEDEESPEGEFFMDIALEYIKTHQIKAYCEDEDTIKFK